MGFRLIALNDLNADRKRVIAHNHGAGLLDMGDGVLCRGNIEGRSFLFD
jgi:hypothetical protein